MKGRQPDSSELSEVQEMRKLSLGLLTLLLAATASLGTPRRATAQVCPLCVIGEHCCIVGNQARCFPDSNPCT
jgi:hypothetical protein